MFPALQDDAVIGGCCWCCSELRTRALIPESIEMRRGVVAPGTNAQEYMKDCVLEMPWTRCCESAADYWLDIFLLSNTALIKNCWSERRVCTRQNKRKRCVVDFLLTFSWTACYFSLVTLKWPWRHSHMVFYKEEGLFPYRQKGDSLWESCGLKGKLSWSSVLLMCMCHVL